MGRCPRCGSTRINQHRMPYGPMWCRDCGFRVEDKTATPNPFVEAGRAERAVRHRNAPDRPDGAQGGGDDFDGPGD